VVAVLLLVLAIFTMMGLYIAHQLPLWRAGEIAGAESIQSLSSQTSGAPETTASVAPALGLSRVQLVLISMVINMAIFVCLGLYLRREMNRLP